jgi:hypothetical protein
MYKKFSHLANGEQLKIPNVSFWWCAGQTPLSEEANGEICFARDILAIKGKF